MNLFQAALKRRNTARPPVWFMRQAGRYHSHYQELKKQHTFIDLCKIPELACETTMGPIRDFDFDAAILFSDLLFPLEVLGTGLSYDPGPKLGWHLKSTGDVAKLDRGGASLVSKLQYQADAMKLIRAALPVDKGLLGFVGGPLTLFCYAVEGSHAGTLDDSRVGLSDGRWDGFLERLTDLLVANMVLQAEAGADAVAVLDTCAGEFSEQDFAKKIVPALKTVLERFQKRCPNLPIVYYSKGTGPAYWRHLEGLPIAGLGIDWRHDIAQVLSEWSSRYAIQGNVDPEWLFLNPSDLEKRLREVFNRVRALPSSVRTSWICGLGHGVMQKTPESNVRLFLKLQKEIFS
jgi:uroporphyrinogen decarboxylase